MVFAGELEFTFPCFITPRNTIENQKRMVFAVELEFTLPSLRSPRKSTQLLQQQLYFLRRSVFPALFVPSDSWRRLRPVPLGAASPYPTHTSLDAVLKPK